MRRPGLQREWEIKLELMAAVTRSQGALARILENVAASGSGFPGSEAEPGAGSGSGSGLGSEAGAGSDESHGQEGEPSGPMCRTEDPASVMDGRVSVLHEHVRALTGMQAALLRTVTGMSWRPPKQGKPASPWLSDQLNGGKHRDGGAGI